MASPIPSVAATSGALAGVRVVDMSRLLPGPLATQFLADFGAEVIKVEDTDGGDYGACLPLAVSDWHTTSLTCFTNLIISSDT